ncbi:VOC family protein [Bradyrhizobium sp. YCK136]|uniref:VOC family protein n=1 Tax=Bradyrhizobium sp. YCK136 TaxID=3351346 RepID=UPI0037C78907
MLGAHRDDAYAKRVGDIGGHRTDAIYLAVDDPDALYEKVKASGATIEMEPYNTDYGSRDFAARDPEGGLWSFGRSAKSRCRDRPDGCFGCRSAGAASSIEPARAMRLRTRPAL